MDGALPGISDFLHRSSIAAANIESAAEQQQSSQPPQPITFFNQNDSLSSLILFGNNDLGLGELIVNRALKAEPDIENWCDENFGRISGYGNGIELGKTSAIARTASCPPPQAAEPATAARGKGKAVVALCSKTDGEINFKKRKANNPSVVAEETPLQKKLKADKEKEKDSNNNKTTVNSQKESPKENSKGLEVAKRDYIHVRARRGQATDSHSLAERVRREKISAKMKYLQNLVPGCNKITGKAGMLDEIINYVQSLQRQVEFLSMKLAAITPSLDFGVDTYMGKEMLSPCGYSIPTTMGVSLLGEGVLSSGLRMGINALDTTIRRTIGAPVCITETCQNSSGLNFLMQQIQPFATDAELQNLYAMDLQQGRSGPFIADQPFIGFTEVGNVKLEEM